MLLGMAAASSAIDLIKTLTQSGSSSKSSSGAKFSANGGAPSSSATANALGAGQTSLIAPDTMNALFAAQSHAGTSAANAESVFDKLHSDGDGSISLGEMSAALKGKHRAHGAKRPNENADALLQALNAALTTADGSAATSTSATASTSATRSYSAVEQMMLRRVTSGASSLSVSV